MVERDSSELSDERADESRDSKECEDEMRAVEVEEMEREVGGEAEGGRAR